MCKIAVITLLKLLFLAAFLTVHTLLTNGFLPKYLDWHYVAASNVLMYALCIPIYQWVFRNYKTPRLDTILFFVLLAFLSAVLYDSYLEKQAIDNFIKAYIFFITITIPIVILGFSNWSRKWQLVAVLVATTFVTDVFVLPPLDAPKVVMNELR